MWFHNFTVSVSVQKINEKVYRSWQDVLFIKYDDQLNVSDILMF